MKAVMLAGQLHLMEWPADADSLKSPGCSSARASLSDRQRKRLN